MHVFSQDPQFSHNMFNIAAINPGYAGSNEDMICANIINRNPYFGFIEGLRTSTLNVHGPVTFFNREHGLGLSLLNDNYGFTDFWGNISYAYKISTLNGEFGIGLKLGVFNKSFELPDNINISQSDPSIPGQGTNKFALDMGLGVFYHTDRLYAGISSLHLHEPKITDASMPSRLTRYYYLTSGYDIELTNPKFEVKPSIFVKTDLATTLVDINANVVYNKTIWGGVSYRPGDAIVGLVGAEVFKDVQVGIAYDFVTSAIGPQTDVYGGFEVILKYCFDLMVEKKPQGYKSVRFL